MSSQRNKIRSRRTLRKIAARLRSAGKKIVFTNGCFDLLHAGHVDYLGKAKRLGDILVIGLNTDSSVRKVKGPSRPITPEKDRQWIIAALEAVDYVTLFSEETPLNLIREIRPHVLVKGADWKKGEIVGAGDVCSWGGRVKRLRFLPGRSTTRILQSLRTKKQKGSDPKGSDPFFTSRMKKPLLRIIDANYNRAKEAIRVTEDIARFYLRDASLTSRFKRVRHDLTKALLGFKVPYRRLVEARDSKEDVGRSGLIRDKKRPGWKDLFLSNLKRAQEAARVLEEFSKMVQSDKTPSFQRIRFRLYELEKDCLRKF